MTGRPAVFLDRDGVLNEVQVENGAPVSPATAAEFRITLGARDAVGKLRAAGWPVYAATNQPDIARGRISRLELERMLTMLTAEVALDDIAVCPHDDADACECRKPRPGMLLDLAARHGLDLSSSTLVGDTWKDMEAGRRAGVRTILLRRSYNANAKGDLVVETLDEAVRHILESRHSERRI